MAAEYFVTQNIACVLSLDNGKRKRRVIEAFLKVYTNFGKRLHHTVREGVVHNDANDYNVLVSLENKDRVCGIIDFGDLLYTKIVNNIAIAAAYAMMNKDDPIEYLVCLVKGYHSEFPLLKDEVEILYSLACLRVCHSVVSSTCEFKKNPNNDYVLVSAKPGWELLEKLSSIPVEKPTNALYAALGFNRQACTRDNDSCEVCSSM